MGTQIAQAIDSGRINAVLTHVYDQDSGRAESLVARLGTRPEIVQNAHLLSSNRTDLVVEAASQDAVRDVALSVIQNRKDLMIMSVGALLDESVFEVLSDACREFKKTIYLPSGAIAGLDGLKAVRDELEWITLTSTKHPKSLRGARFFETSGTDIDAITGPEVIFEGTAGEAVSQFPANINVAALLSLAAGDAPVTVKIIADPATARNTHRIDAGGKFGKMSLTVENMPDAANPKTSHLAVASAIEKLRIVCSEGIQLGT